MSTRLPAALGLMLVMGMVAHPLKATAAWNSVQPLLQSPNPVGLEQDELWDVDDAAYALVGRVVRIPEGALEFG